jgi:pimeloyl-ACP methyl ester carboxylesterase
VTLAQNSVNIAGRDVTLLEGGTGKTILYLHGLCADVHSSSPATEWTGFLSELGDFHLVAPALPGYNGTSGLLDIDDVEDYVYFVVDVLDALGIESPFLVGHSLGGWIATEFALRHPARVAALALVSPLGLRVPGVAVPPFFGAVAPRGIGGFDEARRLLFADPESAAALHALPDDMTADQELFWFTGLVGAARLGWNAPHFQSSKLLERLHRISTPTLVLRGEHDQLVPHESVLAWQEGLATAQLREVPDAGHCLPAESPTVGRDIAAFFEQHGHAS